METKKGSSKIRFVDANRVKDANMAMIIDRMGHLVLGVKAAFDAISSTDGTVTWKEAVSLLLDLGPKGVDMNLASEDVQSSFQHSLCDFSHFLEIYAKYCGLQAPGKLGKSDSLWIPNAEGNWNEVRILDFTHRYVIDCFDSAGRRVLLRIATSS